MPRNAHEDEDDSLLMALQNMEPCGNCGVDGAKLPCMSGCREVFYCSRECMMLHASAHRLRCRNLRCSKFNDSDSESSGDEEITSSEECDTEEEIEEEIVKAKKVKKKRNLNKSSAEQHELHSNTLPAGSVDEEAERRIEEKILRRLKKQEESRIATAIEQRMKEEKANWRDEEMNRIIIEMRERIKREMKNATTLVAMAKKNGVSLETFVSSDMVQNERAEEKSYDKYENQINNISIGATSSDPKDTPIKQKTTAVARTASAAPVWNNSCLAFEALRVVVWKYNHLPKLKFHLDSETGIWNRIIRIDEDPSFSHIVTGDCLIFLNGRPIDSTIQTEDDLNDIFSAFASSLVLKFKASKPGNGKVHDYNVIWSNGPLGVTLKDDCTTDKVPIVNRLTKKAGSVAVKQNIAIGDVLVAINNIDTIQLGCSLSMSILKKVQLPANLRFRGVGGPSTDTSVVEKEEVSVVRKKKIDAEEAVSPGRGMSRPSHYAVSWDVGPLGLTIIPGLTQTDLPVIKKVTGTGTSKGIEQAQVGDFLVSMNSIQTASMPFEDIVGFLKSAPKPVTLKFRAATEEDACRSSAEIVAQNMRDMAMSSSSSSKNRDQTSTQSTPSPRGSQKSSSKAEIPRARSNTTGRNEAYKVIWGSGPLGLTIDALPNKSGAYIKRIASQGAAAHLSERCVGDELTHINDMKVKRLEFSDIVAQLRMVPRPVTLYFLHSSRDLTASRMSDASSPPTSATGRHSDVPTQFKPPSEDMDHAARYYEVLWKDGLSLGLSLRSADNSSSYPYITRVTGAGCAAHLPKAVIGDALISVDGRSVHQRDKTFEEVMNMLKSMPKPLTLRFESQSSSIARSSSSSSMHHIGKGIPIDQSNHSQRDVQAWRSRSRNVDMSSSSIDGQSAPLPSHLMSSSNDILSQSYNGSDTSHEENYSNIQAPFLVQNKLSTNRRQRMLKGMRK